MLPIWLAGDVSLLLKTVKVRQSHRFTFGPRLHLSRAFTPHSRAPVPVTAHAVLLPHLVAVPAFLLRRRRYTTAVLPPPPLSRPHRDPHPLHPPSQCAPAVQSIGEGGRHLLSVRTSALRTRASARPRSHRPSASLCPQSRSATRPISRR
jgi:hypothetical protein